MSVAERIAALRACGECADDDASLEQLVGGPDALVYDGIEPSARMTLAQGLLKALHVRRLSAAGLRYTLWVGDWFAMINNKLDADLKKIQSVAKYMIEQYKALGITELPGVSVCLASEQINARASDYWLLVMDIARRFNLKRVLACGESMGAFDAPSAAAPAAAAAADGDDEKAEDGAGALNLEVGSPRVMYPCMQCADPYFLGARVCHVNAAQRAVVEMSRDYCDVPEVKARARLVKPAVLVHATLPNLKGAAVAAQPPSAATQAALDEGVLYMDDEAADIKKKINRAFCPERECADNPCIELAERLLFALGVALDVKRTEANGGDKVYTESAALRADFASGALHPGDLKPSLIAAVNALLEPVRARLAANAEAKLVVAAFKKLKLGEAAAKK